MNSVRLAILLSSLIASDSIWSQFYFAKTFGGALEDGGLCVAETHSGLFIAGGYTGSFGQGASDAFLVVVNPLGWWQWEKTYGGPDVDRINSIVWRGSLGYAVGFTKSNPDANYIPWLLCIQDNGDTIFTRTYPGSSWSWFSSVVSGDSSLYLAGVSYDSIGRAFGAVWKLDTLGHVNWQAQFPQVGSEEVQFLDLCLLNDSLMVVGGTTYTPSDLQAILVFFNRKTGELLYYDIFGNSAMEEYLTGLSFDGIKIWYCGYVVNPLNNRISPLIGSFLATTMTNQTAPYYFHPQFNNRYNDIFCTGPDDYAVATSSQVIGLGLSLAAVLNYQDDNFLWSTNLGVSGYNSANSILRTSDNGFLIAGEISGTGPGLRALLIWKIDSLGQTVAQPSVQINEAASEELFTILYRPEGLWINNKTGFLTGSALELFDLSGRLLYKLKSSELQTDIFIPRAILPGMGFLRYAEGSQCWVKKFVIVP